MTKIELVFTDEEIDRFAEKVACKLKGLDASCSCCSADYHQEIKATLIRYHTSGDQSVITMPVYYCPKCGRKLS